MPNKYHKYKYSERRQQGSQGLQGEALAFQTVTGNEKKNFQHWLLKKIYDYPRLSETSKLILTYFLESSPLLLKSADANLLTPDDHALVHRYENPPKNNSVPSSLPHSFVKRLQELTVVEPKDWGKVGSLLDAKATYIVIASAD